MDREEDLLESRLFLWPDRLGTLAGTGTTDGRNPPSWSASNCRADSSALVLGSVFFLWRWASCRRRLWPAFSISRAPVDPVIGLCASINFAKSVALSSFMSVASEDGALSRDCHCSDVRADMAVYPLLGVWELGRPVGTMGLGATKPSWKSFSCCMGLAAARQLLAILQIPQQRYESLMATMSGN